MRVVRSAPRLAVVVLALLPPWKKPHNASGPLLNCYSVFAVINRGDALVLEELIQLALQEKKDQFC